MVMPTKFHLPWSQIDPGLKHGGIPNELADEFVGPDLGDNKSTLNLDMLQVFGACRDVAAAISRAPSADTEGPPNRNVVEEVLLGTTWISERILDRIAVNSNRLFEWTHATPPAVGFRLRPIKFPLRNEFANHAVFTLIGELVEIAENNANGHHSRMSPNQAAHVLAPLWHLRANVVRDWFDVEVGGEISVEELDEMFSGIADAEPSFTRSGDSHPRPEGDSVTEALQGIDLFKWHPNKEDWQVFAKKIRGLYVPERLFQPEGALRSTEDIAFENPLAPVPGNPGGQP
jgi:hypothetical protein